MCMNTMQLSSDRDADLTNSWVCSFYLISTVISRIWSRLQDFIFPFHSTFSTRWDNCEDTKQVHVSPVSLVVWLLPLVMLSLSLSNKSHPNLIASLGLHCRVKSKPDNHLAPTWPSPASCFSTPYSLFLDGNFIHIFHQIKQNTECFPILPGANTLQLGSSLIAPIPQVDFKNLFLLAWEYFGLLIDPLWHD